MPTATDRLPPATEQALGVLLVQDGMLSAAQLLAVQQYGQEHNLDLRQAILKLKLLPEERIQTILVEQVPLVQPTGQPRFAPRPSTARQLTRHVHNLASSATGPGGSRRPTSDRARRDSPPSPSLLRPTIRSTGPSASATSATS